MSIQTRKPTGKPPWPITLLAGAEKAGKSYACAEASSSDLIGRTFWIGVGEDDPDEYGAIDGARFEIVQHDGTYRSILAGLQAASAEPTNGVPNLIVLDSATRLWELLSEEAQHIANSRKNKAKDAETPISMDLWNRATDRWHTVMNILRRHNGPSLVTARLDVVTVLDDNGKPTKEKTTKIKSQKSLPFDVGIIVEMPARGETYITGARSLKMDVRLDERKPMRDFTVHGLWTTLGLGEEGATAPRRHSEADSRASAAIPDAAPAQHRQQTQPAATEDAGAQALHARQVAAQAQGPDWPSQFRAAVGSRQKLEALRNMGKRANLAEDFPMFGAIENELQKITDAEQADNVMEGTLV